MRIRLGAIVIVTRAIVVVTRLGCISLWTPHGRQVLTTRGLACWLASWHTAADPGMRNWDVASTAAEEVCELAASAGSASTGIGETRKQLGRAWQTCGQDADRDKCG